MELGPCLQIHAKYERPAYKKITSFSIKAVIFFYPSIYLIVNLLWEKPLGKPHPESPRHNICSNLPDRFFHTGGNFIKVVILQCWRSF